MQQDYCMPAARATATVTEKKSEFIAALAPVQTEEEAVAFLEEVRAAHRTASHNVYAYVLREGARSRYSDDGEPAKTAGLPVLGTIQHSGLQNCMIVVTRYFGGTLLGTGGLVRAYGAAASAAVKAAGVLTMRTVQKLSLQIAYPLYDQVRRMVDEAGARLDGEPEFGADVKMQAVLPVAGAAMLAEKLQEVLRGGQGLVVGPVYQAPF